MKKVFEYPILDGKFLFWWFFLPPMIITLIALMNVRNSILNSGITYEKVELIGFLIIFSLSFLVLAFLVANAFPVIRIGEGGIEVRIYFPFLTRWILLPWNSIYRVEPFLFQLKLLNRKHAWGIIIFSNHIPRMYHIPSLIWGHSIDRNIIIKSGIKGYDDLQKVLQAEKLINQEASQ